MPPGIYQHRRKTIAERFWAKVDKSGGPDACWPWLGSCNTNGYGTFRGFVPTEGTHRTAYILTYGPIPDEMCVCHSCDNPPCCNPAHLFLGTRNENMADMAQKGRAADTAGEKNGHARLTEQDVLAIRAAVAAGITEQDLAPRYGVSRSAIGAVVTRQNWKHL
jgi:hypothetical protein